MGLMSRGSLVNTVSWLCWELEGRMAKGVSAAKGSI